MNLQPGSEWREKEKNLSISQKHIFRRFRRMASEESSFALNYGQQNSKCISVHDIYFSLTHKLNK